MGNEPAGSLSGGDRSTTSQSMNSNEPHQASTVSEHDNRAAPRTHTPQSVRPTNYSQYQAIPVQHVSPQRAAFNMGSLGGALPDSNYNNNNQQRQAAHPRPAFGYQMPNMPQFAGQQPQDPATGNQLYSGPYQNQLHPMYSTSQQTSPQTIQSAAGTGQFYQGQMFVGQPQLQPQISPYFMAGTRYGSPGQMYPPPPVPYGMRAGFSGDPRQHHLQQATEYLGAVPSSVVSGRSGSIASSTGQSSIVRGPPRKPRQTGHAIWIGNLPPQADLMSLVYHVCQETSGLESLFLISKSNCAFANFKDEATCAAAQSKIHDSKFQTVRLVSRLRRDSTGAGLAAPTGPAALISPVVAQTPTPEEVDDEDGLDGTTEASTHETTSSDAQYSAKDKYFIVKSLTVEDLELSVRNSTWATQSHNEQALNKAYQSTDNVYLVFSANKSGEYFGYARMVSPINDDPAAAIEFAPTAQSIEDPDVPKAIPTAATEVAPKGRIIDDSARGTIFWEVERDEEVDVEEEEGNGSDQDSEMAGSKAWGKPFKIEWLSTNRLPFYRTRGLRNPWNSNREVKIARDGTELETSVGQRLVGLFHKLPSPLVSHMPGGGLPMLSSGYPQMGPY